MPTFREDPKIGTKVPLIKTADLNDKSVTEKKLADGSITKDKIAIGAVTSEKLQHNAVTTENINDGAVTSEKIAEGAVSVDEIKDLSVEESKIKNKAVTNLKIDDAAVDTRTIEDKSVTNAKIADESITQEKIFNSSVTTEKLADESVSAEKLQSGLRSTIVSTHDKAIELDKKKANVTDVDYALERLENKIGDRVVVEGNVTNLPDDEDLTSVQIGGREVVKFNDRAYEPSNFSGKGYKILRKNIQRLNLPTVTILVSNIPSSSGDITITINGKATTVSLDVATDTTTTIIATKIGTALKTSLDDYDVSVSSSTIVLTRNNSKYASPSSIDVGNTTAGISVKDSITKSERRNVLTQDMINEPNTVYEIRYGFDLNDAEITMSETCVLKFNGGSLDNGKLIGNDTFIDANTIGIFDTKLLIQGSWRNDKFYSEWFNINEKRDNQNIYIQKCLDCFNKVNLLAKDYHINYPIIITSYQTIEGQVQLNRTRIIKDTNNKAKNIPLTYNNFDLNQDAIIIVVPTKDNTSIKEQYNYVYIENLSLYSNSNYNEYGILASDGRYAFYKNIYIYGCKNGIRSEFSWMQFFEKIRVNLTYSNTIPFIDSVGISCNTSTKYSGYTTIKIRDCYIQNYSIGYKLHNSSYCIFDNCACDNCKDTSYYLYNNHGVTINSNGNEGTNLSEKDYSAAYYINNSEVVMNGCFSTGDGKKSEIENKYIYRICNTSRVIMNNCFHSNDEGVKTKISGYSVLYIIGERTVVDSEDKYELSENSTAINCYLGNILRLGENPVNIDALSIVTSNNYLEKIPISNNIKPGLVPKDYLPMSNVPNGITDADDLVNSTCYVSGNINNLPDERWGVITSVRISNKGVGYQFYCCFSDNTLYVRFFGTSWSKWKLCVGRSSGLYKNKPTTNISIGHRYYCTDLKRTIICGAIDTDNVYKWFEEDGEEANIARSGTFSNKPTPSNIGFQYFNTDTRKMITWDGSKWWNPDGTEATM